ncbi:MAG: hypothetical protein ACREBS_11825, partial [Nitrososphaerales archaeon]
MAQTLKYPKHAKDKALKEHCKLPIFRYTVDGEPQTTESLELTPIQILTNAKIDPQKNYLVLIEGDHQQSYKD